MLYSMTGFGRSTIIADNKKITVEAKTLNSRQLDLSLRLPNMFREVEMAIRERIIHAVERGKTDVNIYLETVALTSASDDETNGNVCINVEAAKSIKKNIEFVCRELNIAIPSDWWTLLVRFPEVMHVEKPAPVANPNDIEMLMTAIDECLESLAVFRRTEGENLEKFFQQRINSITQLLEDVNIFESERIEKIKSRIEEGLKKLQGVEYDRGRLEQEMIFYIEKLDVNEEKQRLRQHLNYFIETMRNTSGGQGKKLGFIAQEMGREINTLGSKSNHAEMQKLVVKMKDELEQIKEQVLNVL